MPVASAIEATGVSKPPSLKVRLTRLYPCLIVAVLATAAAILRFHALGQKSVWIDEGVSIEMARLDWYNFLRILWRHEANMALYTLLLRFWLLLGDTEPWIRTLSVLSAVATIPAVYLLGRKLFDTRVGIMASFLLAINPFHIRYSQEARSYSLFAFLAVLSSLYFLKVLEDPSDANRRGYVWTSVLAVYTHFFAGLLVVAQWLSFQLLDRKDVEPVMRKSWRQFAIAITPLLIFVATTGLGVLRWIPRPDRMALYITAMFFTGGGEKLLWLYAAACAGALIPVIPAFIRFRKMRWEDWRYEFVLIWLLLPFAIVFVVSQWKPCFLARYFIFTVPAMALLAAAGLVRLRWRWLMGGALLLFAALSLPGIDLGYQKDIDIVREDFRPATRYILAHAEPGDAILFHQPIGRMPYEYYRSRMPAAAYPVVIYPAHGEGLTFKEFYAGRPPDALLATVPTQYRRVWIVFTHNDLPGGPDLTTAFISALYGKHYPVLERQTFQEIELRLYCRDCNQNAPPQAGNQN